MDGKKDSSRCPTLPLPGLILLCVLFFLLTGMHARMNVGAYLLAPVGGAVLTLLFLFGGGAKWIYVVPFLAGGVACLCGGDMFAALRALVMLPLGIACAICIFRGQGRMRTIAGGTVCAALWAGVIFALVLLNVKQTPAVYVENLCAELTELLASYTLPNETGEYVQLFSEESAKILTRYCVLLLPAMFSWLFFLMAWFTTVLTRGVLRLLNVERDFFPRGWRMCADRISAGFFVLFVLATFLFSVSPKTENLYYAFSNLMMILFLPFAFAGAEEAVFRVRNSERFSPMSKVALGFLIFLVAVASLYWLLLAAALFAVMTTFRTRDTDGTDRKGGNDGG